MRTDHRGAPVDDVREPATTRERVRPLYRRGVIAWSINSCPGTDVDLETVVGLYSAVGWTAYTDHREVLAAALAGSHHVVLAHHGGALIGLARVVSDGASIAYLQDVLVHPDHRRSGLGAALVEAAMAPYAAVRQKVLLTDDEPGERAFYEASGYHQVGQPGPDEPLRAFVRLAP